MFEGGGVVQVRGSNINLYSMKLTNGKHYVPTPLNLTTKMMDAVVDGMSSGVRVQEMDAVMYW